MAEGLKNPDGHDTRSGVLARPDPKLRAEARKVLKDGGWTMNQFLIACLVLVTKNPKAMLGSLERFKPPDPKPGPKPGRKAARRKAVVEAPEEPAELAREHFQDPA